MSPPAGLSTKTKVTRTRKATGEYRQAELQQCVLTNNDNTAFLTASVLSGPNVKIQMCGFILEDYQHGDF